MLFLNAGMHILVSGSKESTPGTKEDISGEVAAVRMGT